MRSHDQFNTTIYGENDRYRGVFGGRRVIFMNADDMRDRNIAEHQLVDIVSHFGAERRRAAQVQGRALRDPARLRRRLLPGDERAGSGGQRRGRQQPARVEVHPDHARGQRAGLI